MNLNNSHMLPSNRSFGMTFVVLMIGVTIWSFYKQEHFAYWWGLATALLFSITMLSPKLLTPFNRFWMWLGLLLGKIVSPIVIGVMYFILIAPVGIAMRIAQRDALRLSFDRSISSYWIERSPPGPSKESFENQF
ncbi:MAG: hypothetical protein KKF58_00390 [Gammaproteobacteria bacterium]|nr:hypothetical protein [Gammaproteobacteria bacterium]MBU1446744.1 hypothetical protein [Gammaproteobacteria bacterium]